MRINWKFLGERGELQNKKLSMGGVWIFSGTAHFHLYFHSSQFAEIIATDQCEVNGNEF